MKTYTRSFFLAFLFVSASTLLAQGGGNGGGGAGGGGGGGSAGQPDPIAIAVAFVLKGQTNAEQRKTIRLEWLSVAAQQAEDFLRNSVFQRIVDFVQENHDLFESIYAGMKTANSFVSTGKRVKSVISLQRTLLLRFVDTGQLLAEARHFTPDELRTFSGTLDLIIRDTEANFDLLVGLFKESGEAKLTDMERFEVLKTIEQRLLRNIESISQLNRYLIYLDTNRGVEMDSGMEMLTLPR